MSDRIPFPPGPRHLSGGGVVFDVFVRPSGFVVVDEAQIRAIQRRCRYRRIGRSAAWVGRRIATRRAALLMAGLVLASVALWPATLGSGSGLPADAAAAYASAEPAQSMDALSESARVSGVNAPVRARTAGPEDRRMIRPPWRE
jgi:hypothetical protein